MEWLCSDIVGSSTRYLFLFDFLSTLNRVLF
nr:MAG TPA: hypothetical protein [Caudoviricetes sp.]